MGLIVNLKMELAGVYMYVYSVHTPSPGSVESKGCLLVLVSLGSGVLARSLSSLAFASAILGKERCSVFIGLIFG
jgi:hypothetical protein